MGYFTLCFFTLNWKVIFYLFASSELVPVRIKFFEEHTDIWTLLYGPALIGAMITVIYPWLSVLFVYFCEKPTQFKNSMQAKSEHALLVEKQQLQEERRKILARAEKQLIEQAERDQEVESIKDSSLKQKVKEEISELRQINGEKRAYSPNELLEMATQFRQRAGKAVSGSSDYNELKRKATELEDKAHKMMVD
ncbi:hypothetical protein ACSVUS_004847 [Vibrio alginolyticus]|uniref:hypothetical protein n=1 Tax=Vibrio TaxID=662 RepID=UPI001558BAE5|nr:MULTISPECIES: hypothetical protein [Vibrio]EHI5143947.1 hypothetical protein [Vibrio alginolyticus]EIE5866316.1 hypothetical protein [Vibrio alginolyticus]EJG1639893.1 hypothetical protein [Vibrio alginolyticus]EJR0953312.1 hypothetical protein [Vibrio alginolyticus]ELA6641817.1 hypothetical protein [Vibrio alginolyticus]